MRARRSRWWLIGLAAAIAGAIVAPLVVGGWLTAPAQNAVPRPADFFAEDVVIGPPPGVAGWWVPAAGDAPTVLLLHPIRADRRAMLSRARLLQQEGYAVLLIDLPAHGESPGDAITMGVREAAGVQAARQWIRERRPGTKIAAVATSLGAASVVLGPQPSGFDALVVEALFSDFALAIENRIAIRMGPLARFLAPFLTVQLGPRLGIAVEDLRPIDSIDDVGCPILIVAGSVDRRTTLDESEALFAAAREPKGLWVVDGAGHEDFLAFDPDGYRTRVLGFLKKHLGSPRPVTGGHRGPPLRSNQRSER